jgi:ABC-type Na+ efflux pump permease subunit
MLKSRVSSENEKIWQAYAFLQFKVYDADKTTGKLVYRKWQDLVDEYQKERQQQQPTTTTTPSAPSAPSTTQSNPSTSPTPIKEV